MAGVAAAAIAIVTCHPGGAEHLGPIADELASHGHKVTLYASGEAIPKLGDRKIEQFFLTPTPSDAAAQLAVACSGIADVVITDVGHHFAVSLVRFTKTCGKKVFVWYDNPSLEVPEPYSLHAKGAMEKASGVFFANKELVKDPRLAEWGEIRAVGVGFRPMTGVDRVIQMRSDQAWRDKMQADLGGKPVLVLLGGANDVYYDETLPQFLASLDERVLQQFTVVIQRHPRASGKEMEVIEAWDQGRGAVRVSVFPDSYQAIAAAQVVFCGQTTMDTGAYLAGVPVVKIRDEGSILAAKGLSLGLQGKKLIEIVDEATEKMKTEGVKKELVQEALGMDPNWAVTLIEALKA